jgi:hypothetical protein
MSATTPNQPDLNPNLTRWISSPENASWLRKLVSSERGRLLLDVLAEMAVPMEDFHSIDAIGNDVTAKLAYHHCLSSGQNLCIRNIRLLASPIEPVSEIPHDGWQGERTLS